MFNHETLFPDNTQDFLVDIECIKGNTNFSHMGETNGIEIKCKVKFKVKSSNVLMNPDWEEEYFTEKFKDLFKSSYYVFEEFRFEYIHYHFFVDYDMETDKFELKNIKKTDAPSKNYVNSINTRYQEPHIMDFDNWLLNFIINTRIKKVQF